MVVGIDRFAVGAAASWVKRPRSGEEGFDGFVGEHDEGGHRPETASERFVAAGVTDAATMCLPRKLFQIISSVARTVLCAAVITEGARPSGEIGGSEAVG
jgi:hypothetical protein